MRFFFCCCLQISYRSQASHRCPFWPTEISHSIVSAMARYPAPKRNHHSQTQMSQCGQLAQFWTTAPWIRPSPLTKVRHLKRRFFHRQTTTRSTSDIHVIRRRLTAARRQCRGMRHTMARHWSWFRCTRKTWLMIQANRWELEGISHFFYTISIFWFGFEEVWCYDAP